MAQIVLLDVIDKLLAVAQLFYIERNLTIRMFCPKCCVRIAIIFSCGRGWIMADVELST